MLGAVLAYLQFSGQQRASHDLLISNQVSKGFEQLGSEKLVIRLGGIYALEGGMNGSDQYHQPVLEALTAFVREGAKLPTTPGPPTQGLPTEIQAALKVIGRRSRSPGDLVALQTPVKRRARQMGDRRLQGIKAVVERQQSMPSEGDNDGLFLG